ncbi:hypothetical protein ElyMa_003858900 [Elysia marginata]|uniref:Uncharacterized protein n=1 Tax=Elysia marginata TaxID=1093978 RepID=A0AAV4FIA4_9GAST|nr:hypothetical protein ElyMa_003858900 [Elysia marginata]
MSRAAVLLNNTSECFGSKVRVCQGCLNSPVGLLNLHPENIMIQALYSAKPSIAIGWRTIRNLKLADDINLTGGPKNELKKTQIDCQIVHVHISWRSVAKIGNYGKFMINSGENTAP